MALRVSLNWLKDYVDFDLTPADLAERLTLAGLEVESVESVGADWNREAVVVGQVESVAPHPNADRLCLVDVGYGAAAPLRVVTGAPNLMAYLSRPLPQAASGAALKVPFAMVGAELIDGHADDGRKLKLKAGNIRGVRSEGMVCSEKELGISDNHEGIMVLPPEAPIGTPLTDYLGDTIFDLDITPNRADCLSVVGIARELAALTGQSFHLPDVSYEETTSPIDQQISVENVAPDLSPRYCASISTRIQVGSSP